MDLEKQLKKLSRKRNFWWSITLLLVGVIIGYFISPAKGGFRINNIGHMISPEKPGDILDEMDGLTDVDSDGIDELDALDAT